MREPSDLAKLNISNSLDVETPVVERIADNEYNGDDLSILKGLEAVRKRPGMYIGDTGVRGLHHLFKEIIDNSVDEVLAGHCTEINIVLGADYTVSVKDNGRGIPVGIIDRSSKSGVELVLTGLNAGGKFVDKNYKVSGGLHGVGASSVNALSDWLECSVKNESKIHRMRFERGVPVTPLELIGNCRPEEHGTTVIWLADKTIFSSTLNEDGTLGYDADLFRRRISELAYLNKECRFTFHDKLNDLEVEVYHYKRGIAEYVSHLNANKEIIHEPIRFYEKRGSAQVDIALQYHSDNSTIIFGFVNGIFMSDNGTHVTGLKSAVTAVVNRLARKYGYLKQNDTNLSGEKVRQGICAIVSVRLSNPMFNRSDKTRLTNPEVDALVNSFCQRKLTEYLYANQSVTDTILRRLFLP